ncbi:protein FAR-RED IMPAIRED RESPONSE 1-like [Dendrobium catenatum]|uniref:protein FAR-RED IMPAIRED RESPONSE 1-like n=1 Tax=Dendrobium catenatum TaxID=906689 RepID=UPI0009F194A2|nr:protein FAR-RED IMPAIRED RESPONSE 1-like [Dendrobium catenatum]
MTIYSNAPVDGDRALINVPISIVDKETLLAQFASKDKMGVQGDWLIDYGSRRHEKEAYDKYCQYAYSHSFSVRKEHHSFWPNSMKIKSKDFVCSKAGFKKETEKNMKVKFRKSTTRTRCPAMVRFAVSEDGIWMVKRSVESHNHELAKPDDQHLLRSSRGVENLGFTKRDAYNYIQKKKRAKIENGDANSLIELFKDRTDSDNMFAWDVQTDEEDRVTFLSGETIDSFSWLFRTFLKIMESKHPFTIFTDQDQAMARAIEIVLPNTRHSCFSKFNSEEEFDSLWNEMIREGNLQGHQWLKDLTEVQGNEDAEQCMIDSMSAMALNVQNIMEGKKINAYLRGATKQLKILQSAGQRESLMLD